MVNSSSFVFVSRFRIFVLVFISIILEFCCALFCVHYFVLCSLLFDATIMNASQIKYMFKGTSGWVLQNINLNQKYLELSMHFWNERKMRECEIGFYRDLTSKCHFKMYAWVWRFSERATALFYQNLARFIVFQLKL
jgi:hypothetical protein